MSALQAPPRKTVGIDKNHWDRLVINVGAFPPFAQVSFKFKGDPKDIILSIEADGPIAYSFNGNNMHGELATGTDRSQVQFHRRPATGIWFRGSGTVTIEAWASA